MRIYWFAWVAVVMFGGCRSHSPSSTRTQMSSPPLEQQQQPYIQPQAPSYYYPYYQQFSAASEAPPIQQAQTTSWRQAPPIPQSAGRQYQSYQPRVTPSYEDRNWEVQRQAEIIRRQQEQLEQAAREIERLEREQEEMRESLRDAARAYDRLSRESERYSRGYTSRSSVDFAERDFQRALERAGRR